MTAGKAGFCRQESGGGAGREWNRTAAKFRKKSRHSRRKTNFSSPPTFVGGETSRSSLLLQNPAFSANDRQRRKGGNCGGRSKLRRTRFAPDKCRGRVGNAKMTAGRRDFVGKNRAAAGEIPIYIGMVKNDGGGRRESGGGVNSAVLVSPPTNVRGESGTREFGGEK